LGASKSEIVEVEVEVELRSASADQPHSNQPSRSAKLDQPIRVYHFRIHSHNRSAISR